MNTKSVNSAAGVILAALQQNRVPAGIALALDSAGLLMTPETAKELADLRARVAELEQAADTYPPALPWAHAMSDDDLHGFLGDLVSAAMGRWQHSPEVPDREVLAAIEQACANWRTPGQGYRSDEPDESADAITRRIAPTQALREPEADGPRTFHLVGEVTADDYDEAVWAAEQAASGMRGQGYKGSVWVEPGNGEADE